MKEQQEARKKLAELSTPQSPPRTPRASTSCLESQLDVMWEIFNLILGMVNTRRGAPVASHSTTMATPVINKTSFKDMLAEEANFTPSHQPRCVKFADMMQGSLTSTLLNRPQEVALPPRPVLQSHPDEIGLYTAAGEFRKMQEPKISMLQGGYTSSAGLLFQSWLKDISVHVQDERLMRSEATQLVKNFTVKCAQDEVVLHGHGDRRKSVFEGLKDHLCNAFQSGKILSELISDVYGRSQKAKETKDTFVNDLQVLAQKIIVHKSSFWLKANH